MQDVIVAAPGFWTPLIVMHKCLLHLGHQRNQTATDSRQNSRCLHDDGHTTRLDSLFHRNGNLFGEPFLDL